MEFLSVASEIVGEGVTLLAAAEGEGAAPEAFQINFFWIITQALSFLIFLAILYVVAFRRIGGVLEQRRATIEQGLADAEQARKDRERAEQERLATLAEARKEAQEIVSRAQRVAQETRDRDLAAAREELERVRARAADEIESEKQRALDELRNEVADLALMAAGKVVGESMTGDRQRRLVEDFLREASVSGVEPDRGATR